MGTLVKRYRSVAPWARGLLLVVIGISYPCYYMYDQTFAKRWQLNEIRTTLREGNDRYRSMLDRVQSIDALKQNIADLEAEFAVAQDVLPESLNIEQMLLDVARLARKTSVNMDRFEPMGRVVENEAGRFGVRRVRLGVSGPYAAIVSMMDDLVHLNYPLQIEDIDFEGGVRGGEALRQFEAGEADLWRSIEANYVTAAKMTLVYFQALPEQMADKVAVAPKNGEAESL